MMLSMSTAVFTHASRSESLLPFPLPLLLLLLLPPLLSLLAASEEGEEELPLPLL